MAYSMQKSGANVSAPWRTHDVWRKLGIGRTT
jgi:hypothetical protein